MPGIITEKLKAGGAGVSTRRVIIVAPHFPPSNLASVHRSRLFAQHLPDFGWEPIIVTVHHDYYEEQLDWELAKLVDPSLRVERVGALPTRPVRLIGEIGIRGFVPMLRRILKIIDRERIDFLYITIPSHFAAPLGRVVHALRGVPYGIDYIDPWVHVWPGSERPFTKHWIARKLGELLEPFAVRRAALITGVAEGYYQDVFERNPHLRDRVVVAAMPYGGAASDHERVRARGARPYLFTPGDGRFHLVYAGALLPRAHEPLVRVFDAIARHRSVFADVRFHFIGTGRSPNDPAGFNVRPMAEQFGLWGDIVHEHPARIPYLDVLEHLEAAEAVFILGSTEPHYTPSKVYQGVISGKPILAVLHAASTGGAVIRETGAGIVLAFDGEADLDTVTSCFASTFAEFRQFSAKFDAGSVNRDRLEAYSARNVSKVLAQALSRASSDSASGLAAS
jgi:hypothetical protein